MDRHRYRRDPAGDSQTRAASQGSRACSMNGGGLPGAGDGRDGRGASAEPLKVRPPSGHVDTVTVALGELAGEDAARQRVLEVALDRASQADERP